jgi:hypothetical protein
MMLLILLVGPWLWKEAENKGEKVKRKLRGRHSDCHWVEVSKREKEIERGMEKQAIG